MLCPTDDMLMQLKFAALCRKQGRVEYAYRVMHNLLITSDPASVRTAGSAKKTTIELIAQLDQLASEMLAMPSRAQSQHRYPAWQAMAMFEYLRCKWHDEERRHSLIEELNKAKKVQKDERTRNDSLEPGEVPPAALSSADQRVPSSLVELFTRERHLQQYREGVYDTLKLLINSLVNNVFAAEPQNGENTSFTLLYSYRFHHAILRS